LGSSPHTKPGDCERPEAAGAVAEVDWESRCGTRSGGVCS
jgi:hypothetical protein